MEGGPRRLDKSDKKNPPRRYSGDLRSAASGEISLIININFAPISDFESLISGSEITDSHCYSYRLSVYSGTNNQRSSYL